MVSRAKDIVLPSMNLILMKSTPILHQLRIEEKLLRSSSENWCIINDGTSDPTVVMGVSGKVAELVNVEPVIRDGIPVIRRFSGGGTVIVDNGTVFVTLICSKGAVPGLQPFPRPIMDWSGGLYGRVFEGFADFHLRENDYAFGNHKFGGNAQSITKDRWIHHTSFLWDYDAKNMEYLKQPMRAPKYRSERHHLDFLCRMKDYLPCRSTFIERTIGALSGHFTVKPVDKKTITDPTNTKHMSSTKLLTKEDLEAALSSSHENSVVQQLQL
ncbi:putative biotinyl protein ligase (BPL) and lipoyl protein ligase (LPL), catalytic [Dioscorea sansibarensis]